MMEKAKIVQEGIDAYNAGVCEYDNPYKYYCSFAGMLAYDYWKEGFDSAKYGTAP